MNSIHRTVLVALAVLVLAALPASAATYSIDGVHSSAVFKVKHFGVSNFYGVFKDVSGTIEYNPEGESSVEVTIQAGSVDTRMGQRDDHAKSPDFLNAAEFPTITFKSSGVKVSEGSFEVPGKLTLHGVTKDVTATVEKVGEGKNPRSGKAMIGFEAHFTVDRTDFEMSGMVGPLGKEIDFILSVEAGVE